MTTHTHTEIHNNCCITSSLVGKNKHSIIVSKTMTQMRTCLPRHILLACIVLFNNSYIFTKCTNPNVVQMTSEHLSCTAVLLGQSHIFTAATVLGFQFNEDGPLATKVSYSVCGGHVLVKFIVQYMPAGTTSPASTTSTSATTTHTTPLIKRPTIVTAAVHNTFA